MFHFLVPCAINLGFSEVTKFASMDNFLFAAVILFLDNPDSFSVYCIFCFARLGHGEYNRIFRLYFEKKTILINYVQID